MTRQTLYEQAARAARRYNISVTEARDRFARQLRPCSRCGSWKPLTEFDFGKSGNRYRKCRKCRTPKVSSKEAEQIRAARWVAPPEAKKAAREFLILMDVPEHWRVPK